MYTESYLLLSQRVRQHASGRSLSSSLLEYADVNNNTEPFRAGPINSRPTAICNGSRILPQPHEKEKEDTTHLHLAVSSLMIKPYTLN